MVKKYQTMLDIAREDNLLELRVQADLNEHLLTGLDESTDYTIQDTLKDLFYKDGYIKGAFNNLHEYDEAHKFVSKYSREIEEVFQETIDNLGEEYIWDLLKPNIEDIILTIAEIGFTETARILAMRAELDF